LLHCDRFFSLNRDQNEHLSSYECGINLPGIDASVDGVTWVAVVCVSRLDSSVEVAACKHANYLQFPTSKSHV